MGRFIFRTPNTTTQVDDNTSADLLIQFIVGIASQLGNGISKIRLIKFLYLADVHWFRKRSQQATTYRWRFYHYGPYTGEAQADIDAAVSRGAIGTATMSRDEGGDMTLYRATGVPDLSELFDASFEVLLSSEIRQWLWRPLPQFLNYVYFDTPGPDPCGRRAAPDHDPALDLPRRGLGHADLSRPQPGAAHRTRQEPGPPGHRPTNLTGGAKGVRKLHGAPRTRPCSAATGRDSGRIVPCGAQGSRFRGCPFGSVGGYSGSRS